MATQLEWYKTFLADKTGRAVLFELRTIMCTRFRQKDQPITPEVALAQCVLDDTVLLISERCGIDTPAAEMRMIEHEAAVAASMLDLDKKGPVDKDLHETH